MVRFRQIGSITMKNETDGYKLVQSKLLILTSSKFLLKTMNLLKSSVMI